MMLITGGCGFIGSNLAENLLEKKNEVTIIDNLFRKGTEKNLEWLKSNYDFKMIKKDIRDDKAVEEAAKGCNVIFHTAAQTAVTTSLKNPKEDFEINTLGTVNVLEAARKHDCSVIFCSTNKVYGKNVNDIPILEKENRYEFSGDFKEGVDEKFPIDSSEHTPYGSSKLAADQYVRDYASVYGIKTIINRMSCIYGTRQFGTVDQGWVVHFILSTILEKPLTIYGNGKQVRDILFVSDLVNLFEKEYEKIHQFSGNAYNIGGSKQNTISLLELMEILEKALNKKIKYEFSEWRAADQKVFYSDISKAKKDFNWEPKVSSEEGVSKTLEWIKENISLFS